MARRIIIFGATGFTGRLLAQRLAVQGAQPVLAGRSDSSLRELAEPLGLEWRVADALRQNSVFALLERGPAQVNIPRDHFYGEFDYTIATPVRVERSAGAPESLDEAATLLAGAKFPVIVAGGGVIMSNGVGETMALAEHLDAPVRRLHGSHTPTPYSPPLEKAVVFDSETIARAIRELHAE